MQSTGGRSPVAALCVLAVLCWPDMGQSEEAWLASARLRGGYDANPMLLPGKGHGVGFAGVDAAFAAGRGDDERRFGITADVQRTEFFARDVAPSERYGVALKGETTLGRGWTLRATTQATSVRNYSLQSFDAVATAKLRPDTGLVRPFLTTELRHATLNETSVIFGDFLPEPQRFTRATAIPGVVLSFDAVELGTSVNVSATRYADEPDIFGFRRNNERVQPYLFASLKDQGLELAGSISYLRGFWHDVDFSPVREFIWDASLTKTAGALTLELAVLRGVEDTTFPISPLAVVTNYIASVSYAATERLTLRVFARALHTDYLDSPFTSRTRAAGLGVRYDLGKDYALGFELAQIRGVTLADETVKGGMAMLSIAMKLSSKSGTDGDKTQRAVAPPPAALSPNPALDVRSTGRPYQP